MSQSMSRARAAFPLEGKKIRQLAAAGTRAQAYTRSFKNCVRKQI
jgi:hypothetical protein